MSFRVDEDATARENAAVLAPQVHGLPFENIVPTADQLNRAADNLQRRVPAVLLKHGPDGYPMVDLQTGDWLATDHLVDCFNGRVRLMARKAYDGLSCMQWWDADFASDAKLLLHEACRTALKDGCDTLRQADFLEAMWTLPRSVGVPRECTPFRATRAKDVVHCLLTNMAPDTTPDWPATSWLDMSAGWGDRLMAAAALGMRYVGFDPNRDLCAGHAAIVNTLGDAKRQQVVPLPFECRAAIQHLDELDETFDVAFTSPPYFDLEIYNTDDPFQSVRRHPSPNKWLGSFLCYAMELAWRRVKVGGVLAVNIDSTPDVPSADVLRAFFDSKIPDSTPQQTFGFGSRNYSKPAGLVFVWRKEAVAVRDTNPHFERAFSRVCGYWQDIRNRHKHTM
jgi:hypothetical protein